MFDVLTVGSATGDTFVRSKDFQVRESSGEAGRKFLVMPLGAKLELDEMIFTTGGGATNTAVTFARQGFRTAVLCEVGDDVSGKAIVDELTSEKVFTGLVRRNPKLRTGSSLLLHPEGDGERTVLVYRGASESLAPKGLPWTRMQTQWMYVSSVAGNLALLKELFRFAEKQGIAVAYNPGGRELAQRDRLIPLLGKAKVVIVNREEAATITGAPYDNEQEIFRVWDALTPGTNVSIMTDGHNGVAASDGRFLYRAATYPERAIKDRTGAGDAFGSGLVAGLMRHTAIVKGDFVGLGPDAMEYAIRLGSANATAKVEGIGAKYGLLTRNAFERGRRWKGLRIERSAF